jgi:hypothetical protein
VYLFYMKRIASIICGLYLSVVNLHAADFYVAPDRGSMANPGSQDRPWSSLQEVIDGGLIESREWESLPAESGTALRFKNPRAAVRAGDTLWLESGYYGDVTVNGFYNESPITIAAVAGHTPKFRTFTVRSSSHWVLKGLHVSPEFGEGDEPRTLLRLNSHRFGGPIHDITVDQCFIQSAGDTSAWSSKDWNDRAYSGIDVDGTRMTVRSNRLLNVDFGISVTATHSLIEHNTVENFAGDGLRGIGEHCVFQYNTVKNLYLVNSNHPDAFQSWSSGPDGPGSGELEGIIFRGNTIINYEDPEQPHRGNLQGIGCFAGMYVDWIIENNVIIVDHWHGISLVGARGCRIVNNTVIARDPTTKYQPWVRVAKHRNGMLSSNCVVRNNLGASKIYAEGSNMTVDHNVVVRFPGRFFVDPAGYDLRLRKESPAIESGSNEFAPETDIIGVIRPQGERVDLGAHEFVAE